MAFRQTGVEISRSSSLFKIMIFQIVDYGEVWRNGTLLYCWAFCLTNPATNQTMSSRNVLFLNVFSIAKMDQFMNSFGKEELRI